MAVNTWDGSSSTDWGTAANWTTTDVTDRVPTADDDVVIPDCSSINNCILDGDTTINSLELGGSSNFSMNNHDLTIVNENGSGRALDVANNTITFVGGTGTLIFTKGSSSTDLVGVEHLAASTELRNLQFNGAATFNLEGATTVTGNLTISAGTVTTTGSNHALTVTGDVSVTGTLTGNASAISMGSLTIASGGTYSATSGTTTITSKRGDNESAWANGGTLTHNNGKVKFAHPAAHSYVQESNFYDLELAMGGTGVKLRCFDSSGSLMSVWGDLTITQGIYEFHAAGDEITVHGNTHIAANGTFNDIANASGDHIFHGLITNLGEYKTSSGTNTFNGGIRNLGTFVSAHTITIGGTGGILEGNLDDANVNVNLDKALLFDGDNDYVVCGTDSSLDITAAITMSAWIKTSMNDTGFIIAKDDDSGDKAYNIVTTASNTTCRIYDGGTAYTATYATSIQDGSWHHVCGTYDGSNVKIYVDGVLQGTTAHSGDIDSEASEPVHIGQRGDNNRNLEQHILDARIYNAALAITDVKVLASKINGDASLVSTGTTNLKGWWKLNAETASGGGAGTGYIPDSSPESNQGTLTNFTGTYWDYDGFSVNVQDNSTTTDGTFTVTQGKLECKALSYLHLDETADAGVTANAAGAIDDLTALTKGTISLWTRADNWTGGGGSPDDHWVYSLTDESGNSFFGLQTSGWVSPVGRVRCALYKSGAYQFDLSTDAAVTSLDKWHHIVVTQDSSGPVIYVDGVKPPQTFQNSTSVAAWWDDVDNADYQLLGGGLKYSGAAQAYEPDGDFRDYRFYDYALSAKQVASLYSGSYNVTPNHHIKFDDASVGASGSTGNIADSGTDTAWVMTYTSSDTTNDKIVNGTLDLDSTLTIAANGTLSAPRGNLEFTGNLDINCTNVDITSAGNQFIHNNGKFIAKDAVDAFCAPNNATFFNFDLDTTSGHDFDLRENITILGTLDLTASTDVLVVDAANAAGNITMTMGNADNQAIIESNTADTLRFNPHATREILITGGSSLKPCRVTGQDWKWDNGAAGAAGIKLANMDFEVAVDTDTGTGNAVKIILTGDCEFDAVTVSSGDTLDLNGQRMVTSGTLSLVDGSHFDASGGSFAYCNNFDNATTGTITTDDNSYLILTGAGVSADWQTNSKAPFRNLMINSAGTVTANGNQDIDSDMEKVIIGAGTLTTSGSNYDVNASDMTIATGGTLTANGSDITVAGDFTTSGGLLGASCLNLADNYYGVNATATTWGFTSAYTIEMWFKTGTDSGTMRLLDLYDTVQGNNIDRIYLRLRSSDDQVRFGTYDSSDDHDGMETSGIDCNDGKWHHLAVTCSGTVKQIYYDGKLNASKTVGVTRSGDTAMKLYVGADKDGANKFTGQIEELRIFSVVRTEAEIRADMFQGGTLANSGNLTARYGFNEGTGTAVDNSETTAARDLVLTNASSWAGAGTFTATSAFVNLSGTGTVRHANGTINLSASTGNLAGLYASNSAIFNLNGYNLNFGSGATWEMGSSTTLSGTGSVAGNSSTIATTTIPSGIDAEIVGNASYLAMQSGSDLTVVGNVTGCTFADSTANIRQWHHTLDTQQLLDADEAGDDDLRLTKPTLDNSHELQTG